MNEFYVGYLPKVPEGIARVMRITIVSLLALAAAGAILFASVQRTFAPSAFEFGKLRDFEGVMETQPYPSLLVARPVASVTGQTFSRYLLVAVGKHGADSQVAGFDGQNVKLRGTLIYRDGQTMVEIVGGSISALGKAGEPRETAIELGTFELTGKVVDSKCYMGVMNPGSGKVHRDCATRCLSGGIPPSFITNNLNGASATLLLADHFRHPLAKEAFVQQADRPLRIRGTVLKSGETYYLETSSEEITRLP